MRTSTSSLPRHTPKKSNFSSHSSIHRPPVEPGIFAPCKAFYLTEGDIYRLPREIDNPWHHDKLCRKKFNKPWLKREKIELPDEFWKVVIASFSGINDRPCWAGNRKLGQRSRTCTATATKYKTVAEYIELIGVETRKGKGTAHRTDLIRVGDVDVANRLLFRYLRRRTDSNSMPNSSYPSCSDKCQSSNQGTAKAKSTDPEPEPIHETAQDPPDKPQLVDNVYSGNTAENPVKTPIPEPGVPQVQAFRQTLANWFGVAVSFQTTLWLLCFMQLRRWNVRAFFRDVERNHKPKLFHSQDAAWRYIAADYLKRGPTLESIPPEKRIAQSVAPTGAVAAESPPVSYARLGDLCAEAGTTEDRLVWWMLDQKKRGCPVPLEWPPPEAEARNWIKRYCASLDRSRSSASSDAASSSRASSDTSGAGDG